MKYIVYIYVHVLYTLDQHSSVKNYLAIQKRKLLKWYAFTWHLQNMALIVIYLKKKILLSGHPSKNAYLELPPGSFQIQEGWIFFFKLKVYICSLLKIGKKQKCP